MMSRCYRYSDHVQELPLCDEWFFLAHWGGSLLEAPQKCLHAALRLSCVMPAQQMLNGSVLHKYYDSGGWTGHLLPQMGRALLPQISPVLIVNSLRLWSAARRRQEEICWQTAKQMHQGHMLLPIASPLISQKKNCL